MSSGYVLQPEAEASNRYARQMIIPGIGREGQKRLKDSHVLVAGAGGLGSLSSLYLCGAGVGHLTIADMGRVQPSDLNRQILYEEKDIGEPKVLVATRRLSGMNSDVEVSSIPGEIKEETVGEMLKRIELVVDGMDNVRTRLVLNKACYGNGIPYIYGGIFGLRGSVTTIIPGQTPCLSCFVKDERHDGSPIPAIGPVVGTIASIQVMEALKVLLRFGTVLAGELLRYDGSRMTFSKMALKKRPDCPVCSGS